MDASGAIRATSNGGTSWSRQTAGNGNILYGMSCASTSSCWAVGNAGTIYNTTNGGSTWSTQTSGTSNTLYGISCTSTSACGANGSSGTIDGLAGTVPVPIFGTGTAEQVVFATVVLGAAAAIFVAMRRRSTRGVAW